MATRVNFEAALHEFVRAERAFYTLLGRAGRLAAVGGYTANVASSIQKIAQQLTDGERELYRLMRESLPEAALRDMPEPPDYTTAVPAPGELEARVGTAGLGGAGLGLGVAGWALIALAVVAAAVAIGYLGAQQIHEFWQSVRYAVAAYHNSSRYEAQLGQLQSRFEACLRGGETPERCAELFPTPTPPIENPDKPDPSAPRAWWEWALLGAAAVGVGWAVWASYHKGRASGGDSNGDTDGLRGLFDRTVKARPKALPAGSYGGGGYNMQVK